MDRWFKSSSAMKDVSFPEGNWTEEEKRQRLEQLSYDTFHTLLPTVLFVVVLLIIGLPGNLLVFFVYFKQFLPSPTRVFVLSLAICDMTINVFGLPRQIIMMRFSYRSQGVIYCRLVEHIPVFPILMSYWLLVCVALERRHRICNPLSRHLNQRQATYVLLVPFTLTALVIFPFIHLLGEGPFDIGIPGLQGIKCTFPTNHNGINFEKVYGYSLIFSFAVILTLLVISYVNILLVVLRQRGQLKQYAANQPFGQQTLPLSSTKDSSPASTRGQEDLTASTVVTYIAPATAAIAVETSKEETETNAKARALDEPEPKEDPESREETTPCDAETNAKARVLDEPEPKEVPESRENSQEPPALPVSNNNNSSRQVQNQQSPTFVITAAEEPLSTSNSIQTEEARENQLKSGTATLAIPSSHQNDSSGTEDGSSSQRPIGSEQPEQPGKKHEKKVLSKTTLMMLVLTGTTVICCFPYFYVELSKYQYVGQSLSSLTTNIRFLARVFPSVNSVINPFIYNFFNPRFQAESTRFLTKMKNFFCQNF